MKFYGKTFKDHFVGKLIQLRDRKDPYHVQDAIHIIDMDIDNHYVYFMEDGGDPEWDILRGDYRITCDDDGMVKLDVSEDNWHWYILLEFNTGKYIALEW